MGVGRLHSSSSYDRESTDENDSQVAAINIDYSKFDIISSIKDGWLLIVKIKYHDCDNYEGMKIMVYEKIDTIDLLDQKTIDPHFSNNKKFHSPIARFEPTDQGMENAICFVDGMLNSPDNSDITIN